MYNLPYFKDTDPESVLQFMRAHPFATITGCAEDGTPVATQIPLLLEERADGLFLSGHMMRQTDHHKAFEKNPNVLCLFTSPHTYVSATWYTNPYQGSTWNYMTVHARGTISFLGEQALADLLRKLSLHFENNNTEATTAFDNLPESYTSRLMPAIVAFEVKVEHLDNVFKLSQNRDHESFRRIIRHLEAGGDSQKFIAEEMRKRESVLYPPATTEKQEPVG
ncbi:MAG TPA: FMN-binding negative transcriptional regulator [Flavisolibacter sp.]